jgi:thioesterase domain-containing protein
MYSEAELAAWRQELTRLWTDSIPLATAMQVKICRLDNNLLELAAPLAANRNHLGTAFGGSLQGLATLAGWGVTLVSAGPPGACHVVVREAQMRFLVPVSGELIAEADMPRGAAVAAFRMGLQERGRARLTVPVVIRGPGESPAARFVGEFVAFARES